MCEFYRRERTSEWVYKCFSNKFSGASLWPFMRDSKQLQHGDDDDEAVMLKQWVAMTVALLELLQYHFHIWRNMDIMDGGGW